MAPTRMSGWPAVSGQSGQVSSSTAARSSAWLSSTRSASSSNSSRGPPRGELGHAGEAEVHVEVVAEHRTGQVRDRGGDRALRTAAAWSRPAGGAPVTVSISCRPLPRTVGRVRARSPFWLQNRAERGSRSRNGDLAGASPGRGHDQGGSRPGVQRPDRSGHLTVIRQQPAPSSPINPGTDRHGHRRCSHPTTTSPPPSLRSTEINTVHHQPGERSWPAH
jgi:hypothetical protein